MRQEYLGTTISLGVLLVYFLAIVSLFIFHLSLVSVDLSSILTISDSFTAAAESYSECRRNYLGERFNLIPLVCSKVYSIWIYHLFSSLIYFCFFGGKYKNNNREKVNSVKVESTAASKLFALKKEIAWCKGNTDDCLLAQQFSGDWKRVVVKS